MGYGDEGDGGNPERTAFRNAEKKYKLYKDSPPNKSRRKQWRSQYPPVDLSQVVDFNSIHHFFSLYGTLPSRVRKLPDDSGLSIFTLDDRPEEQHYLVKESLTSFSQPPNRTNHNAICGPIRDLFDSYLKEKVLVESCVPNKDAVNSTVSTSMGSNGS